MSRFAHIEILGDDGDVSVTDGGAFLADALSAARARGGESPEWRAVATQAAAGTLSGEQLSTAIEYLRALIDPRPPPILLASDASAAVWQLTPYVPSAARALAAWPRRVTPEDDLDAIGFSEPRDLALSLLCDEGRAVVFGGIKLTPYWTAAGILADLARLAGVEVTGVSESWEPTCTRERLRAGQPVGGGELRFAVEGAERRIYLSFDEWFAFDHVESMLEHLPARGGRRLRAVRDAAAVTCVDDDEAARLLVDWGVVFTR